MGYPEDNFNGAIGNRGRPSGKGGRKPKLIKKWLKEINVEKKDAQMMLANILFGKTLEELDQLRKSEYDQVSAATFALIGAAITASKKSDFSIIGSMFAFLFGKDAQPISIQDDDRLVDLKNLLLERAKESPEERERIIAELEKATGNPG
jgi:hypothetical protein